MRSALQLEPPDACGRDTSLELGDATESRYLEVRGDIRQRIQNEVALHYPGMREGELRIGASLATVYEHVEIDHPRTPALALLQGGASLRSLYRTQACKQRRRIELRKQPDHGVDKFGLPHRPEGL